MLPPSPACVVPQRPMEYHHSWCSIELLEENNRPRLPAH